MSLRVLAYSVSIASILCDKPTYAKAWETTVYNAFASVIFQIHDRVVVSEAKDSALRILDKYALRKIYGMCYYKGTTIQYHVPSGKYKI